MRHITILVFALSLTFFLHAQQPTKDDLSGIWQLAGDDGGSAYHGVLMVQQEDDGTYKVAACTLSSSARGIGMRKGDILSVAWYQKNGDGIAVGLTVYTIKGKSLEGEWRTVAQPNKAPRTERAKWLAKLKPSEI